MAAPETYERQANFVSEEIGNPDTAPAGSSLDAEFDAIATAVASTQEALAEIRRDDGSIQNGIVNLDNLHDDVIAFVQSDLEWTGDWVTATNYALNDVARSSNKNYICIVAHTSGTFATDLAAGKWQQLGDSPTASELTNVPAGNVSATNVQDAINELDAEKQPLDAGLTSIAALTTAADKMFYATAADNFALTTLTAFARTILDDANAGAVQTTIGLAIGTNVQAYDADTAKLDVAQSWTKQQAVTPVALTDGANIATDASLSNAFRVTLAGNRTLDNPTNLRDGQSLTWRVTQDGTGSRTLAYGSKFKWPGGAAPTLSTGAGERDMISAIYWSDLDVLDCVINKDMS